jgi:hypothetical protein
VRHYWTKWHVIQSDMLYKLTCYTKWHVIQSDMLYKNPLLQKTSRTIKSNINLLFLSSHNKPQIFNTCHIKADMKNQFTWQTKFSAFAPNTFSSLVWYLFHVTILAPVIFKFLLIFCKNRGMLVKSKSLHLKNFGTV